MSVLSWLRGNAMDDAAEEAAARQLGPTASSSGPGYFYGNDYVDFTIFSHFFAHPPVIGGTYVEIGGSNGVHASNTLFFEQHLDWTGVLIEPTP